ncbi:quinone oxidoreductase family protein [Streptomyces nymphaeiformis]|jgi:NADPH:quinone reductase-like Zn-dependent oxidoreductase|uniref:NADPH:quinone reductase-like Zn-dependent oxidoreductase n=1 Tax=Streptomyces nymphaeiformis TaxID=2663842 RepID=A0A7W7U7G6_9ACTN|nr:zinc-binding dehydrogenase [Streptomyces nymphaeiformis]MBB4986406.1 NADPH:quinone reductase-like Zn-dependent oxidoreductase [Streptomyces nymphaeiformis]
MRRVRYEVTGGPEVLFVEEASVPEPGPGELLVRNEAVGVTLPAVRKVREAAEPGPLGGEVAGVVAAVGEGVTGFSVGDRVTGLCFSHAYAELALVHEAMASRIPDRATAVDAVALVRSGLVARGAYEAGRPRPGDSVMVTAAASAVGTLALQYAGAGGASRVVAAVGSAEKAEFVRALGADEVVLYGDESWGEPVDVVLDGVGGELLGPAVRALAPGGRLVAFSSGGGTVDAYELLVRGASVIGFQMAAIARGEPELYARWRDELWDLHRDGALRPRVCAEIPLAEAARAHELVESRRNAGKVVLVP